MTSNQNDNRNENASGPHMDAIDDSHLRRTSYGMFDNTQVITLCGSTKFKKEFIEMNKYLSLHGHVVITVAFFGHADNEELSEETKTLLDAIHKRKIDLADKIVVIDQDNYIGNSTKSEIEYAANKGKPIEFASQHYPEILEHINN